MFQRNCTGPRGFGSLVGNNPSRTTKPSIVLQRCAIVAPILVNGFGFWEVLAEHSSQNLTARYAQGFDTLAQPGNLCNVGRTVFVGDVHGCAAELSDLLDSIAFCETDRLVFVGDLIARGPDSAGVLDIFRRTAALGVLGNHEERLLQVHEARNAGRRGPRLGPAHYRLSHQLQDTDWKLLAGLPRHLDLPEHNVRVVHAGVDPDLPFEAQDPWTLTHIRTLSAQGVPSERAGGQPWAARYRQGPHIVFGHNSRLSLQVAELATGLDTACVYGGKLSSLVLERGQPVPSDMAERRSRIVSVRARKQYYTGLRSMPPLSA
jgi:hypothetical protein